MSIEIFLPKKQRSKFKTALRKAGRREIGGILMAEQLAANSFKIVDFSIDNITGGEAHFCRGVEQHTAALMDFYTRTGSDYSKFNYLGEWHSHPSYSVTPSLQDICAMNDLVTGERGIDFSVLMIARLNWSLFFDASINMFSKRSPPEPVVLK